MLTYSPTPHMRDLIHLIGNRVFLDDIALAQPWCHKSDQPIWFSKSAWTLACIALGFRLKCRQEEIELWVPSYFCNQSLWPLRQIVNRIRFYPVDSNMVPKWSSCQDMLRSSRPDLFLITQFFGQEAPLERAQEFCKKSKALLIEDCAHIFQPEGKVGTYGDFVFYSPHKLLPTPDGSILLIRHTVLNFLPFIQDAAIQLGNQPPFPWTWIGKRIAQKMISQRFLLTYRERKYPSNFDAHPSATSMAPRIAMSQESRKLLSIMIEDLPRYAMKRRTNETALLEVLGNISGWTPWPAQGNQGRIPYYAVLKCDSPSIAQDRFRKLRRKGLAVQTWPDLPPEVIGDPGKYSETIHLRSTLLTFPIHQSMNPEELVRAYTNCLN